ncbi:unnamed protein product [Cochlearia groenlandica]
MKQEESSKLLDNESGRVYSVLANLLYVQLIEFSLTLKTLGMNIGPDPRSVPTGYSELKSQLEVSRLVLS